ncbi:short chain dehydrogenase/reductase family Oxidoreductase [Colletotrichum graminicola M1.001]|uniref:Short chain dehydrogenase/reductase family Oxidoreductase n=1 Tax=Colletotrichum graminicola (strain M1.001 / M2 / FGSC 10212) TaxID=645133 RepID=E3QWB2_COLGM|nr:short chain dehydrogenase/reductase family Oxidoreductase [Colletotrichum graminicola M1.001]EFQ35146.1 short chain dehydrogenase/reductase family Oxidoreductase [Colletotrichum graminicola M1.001]
MGLEAKTVLLTGAVMGIGKAIANALADKGASLVLLSRSEGSSFALIYDTLPGAAKAVGYMTINDPQAGLALGAPARFQEMKIQDIITMSNTNINAPPFPGEAVYHASKTLQEGFTNSLRNELVETDIKGLALRPGVVATHFHTERVGFDKNKEQYNSFIEG